MQCRLRMWPAAHLVSVHVTCRCPDCSRDCTAETVATTPWLQVAGHAFNDLAEADSQLVLYRYCFQPCALGRHARASAQSRRMLR